MYKWKETVLLHLWRAFCITVFKEDDLPFIVLGRLMTMLIRIVELNEDLAPQPAHASSAPPLFPISFSHLLWQLSHLCVILS